MKARGGFVVNIEWYNGSVTKVKVKSLLGGNCRIRSYNQLSAAGNFILRQTTGTNPNSFYSVPDMKEPLVSPEAKLKTVELKKNYLYDFETKQGKEYSLVLSE